ncbi:chemosensory pili system protein ChpB (putative protein-glutamate methylesterase) [Natronocella acetinitrilica]|uniref:protein-glutamate methylesterase n=1 Tax=Natronocella acetinitrilica TaxID=414046 RepID=A0AAE3KBY2_9GAMM|nr:chemotaxis protein CheB [Natronocella acetinitrilica]MCP1675126.1 chemosensory pili system protein ChpB (putative protein-glutamate methylesterase) [Natronocella acetinitrilica]
MASGEPNSEQQTGAAVRVGLMADAEAGRDLRLGLERCGLKVERLPALPGGLRALDSARAQVLLVDLADASDTVFDALEELLENAPVPIVLNESGRAEQTGVWFRRLAAKLTGLAGGVAAPASARPLPAKQSEQRQPAGQQPAEPMVWVLGASFGGPEAVRRFFAALPGAPGAIFFLAQHIGDGFVELLASQLNRTTALRVVPARDGDVAEPGMVLVAPVNHVVRIGPEGTLRLEPDKAERSCRPSVDLLMQEVASRYGPRAGAIVFSGMGDDGALGVRAIAAAGGEVWAQDSGSSSVSSMPDCAAATGAVSRRGTPEELAGGLAAYLEHRAAAS